MDNDLTITSVTEAVEKAIRFKHNWWRGQPQEYNTLIPKIFRKDCFADFHDVFAPNI